MAEAEPATTLRFLSVARGSLTEVETLLLASERLRVAPIGGTADALEAAARVGRMLAALIRSLHRCAARRRH